MGKNELSTENKFVSTTDFLRANKLSSSTIPKLGKKILKEEKRVEKLEKAAKNAENYNQEAEIRNQKRVLEGRIRTLVDIRIEFEEELIGILNRLTLTLKKEG